MRLDPPTPAIPRADGRGRPSSVGQRVSNVFLARSQGLGFEMILSESIAQELKAFFRGIDNTEKVNILGRNRARVGHGLEINHAIPVFASVDDDQDLLGQLLRLGEREDFKEFVHGAEASGKNDQSLGQIGEPELAHEEVMKLEVE